MKTLLLLGGSRGLLPVIKAAHNMGLYVVTCDYIPNNYAHSFSDKYVNASIVDKNLIMQVAKDVEADGIMSFATDPGVATCAFVCEKLGLPSPPYKSVEILQNKALFRKFLQDNSFNVPRFNRYANINEALFDVDSFTYPLIVKPTDSAGSKGVTRVDNLSGLKDAMKVAFAGSIKKEIIIEEFLEKSGASSDTDSFSIDNELVFCGLNAQMFDEEASNPYTPAYYMWPSTFTADEQYTIRSELQRLISLLNIGTSIYNFECRVGQNEKEYIMELSPRGGGNRLAEVEQLATNAVLIPNAIRAALGEPLHEIGKQVYNGVWANIVLHGDKQGSYQGIWYSSRVKSEYIVEEDVWIKKGALVEPFTGANKSIGHVILRTDSFDELTSILSNLKDNVKVLVY